MEWRGERRAKLHLETLGKGSETDACWPIIREDLVVTKRWRRNAAPLGYHVLNKFFPYVYFPKILGLRGIGVQLMCTVEAEFRSLSLFSRFRGNA